MEFTRKDKYGISDLLEIVDILRSPDGCPWDIKQTHVSIRRNFLEEAYEVAEAIDNGDSEHLQEELGDVLLQVVFHARIEKERGVFDFGDVCDGICKKMILRHPHIFSDVKAETAEQVLENWDAIKKIEKKQDTVYDVLNSVAKSLPALIRADKLLSKASAISRSGTAKEALQSVQQTLDRIREALKTEGERSLNREVGNLLWEIADLARLLGVDSDESLSVKCNSFVESFAGVQQE